MAVKRLAGESRLGCRIKCAPIFCHAARSSINYFFNNLGGGKPRGLVESIVVTALAILSLLRSGCKGGIVLIIPLITRGCEERRGGGGTQDESTNV